MFVMLWNKKALLNEDINRCFTTGGNLSKFDKTYNFIISEYAKDLYSPESLLKQIVQDLKTHKQYFEITTNDIKNSSLNKQIKQTYLNTVSKHYLIYVLYFDPIKEIHKLNWPFTKKIHEYFITNPNSPAATFFCTKSCIITLNSRVIDIFDSDTVELHLDHELNHIFGKFTKDFEKYQSLDSTTISKIKQYMLTNKIVDYNEIITDDFSMHMYSQIEFISMLSNICNIISIKFDEKDKTKVLKKFTEMTSESFIKSDSFQQLNEPLRGSLLFAFICRKFHPNRWNRVIIAVKEQLNLNNLSGSIKIFLNKLKEIFNNILKNK